MMFVPKIGFLKGSSGSTPQPTSDTVLLLHLDSDSPVVDSSSYNQPLTLKGSATIASAQSKFGGKSAYFNGPSTGDRIEVSNNGQPISSLDLGSDDFTIEFWVYFIEYDSGEGGTHIIGNHRSGISADWLFAVWNNGQLGFSFGASTIYSGSSFAYNSWVHIAAVRSGNTIKLFQNGFKVAEASFSGNIANTIPLTIGGDFSGTNVMKGYVDEVRIIKGQAVYSNDFSPPVSSYGSETSLLLHFDGANNSTTFTDSGANNLSISGVGNAKISTTNSKFGSSSLYLDGSGDWIVVDNAQNLYASSSWTIECWIYLLSYGDSGVLIGHRLVIGDYYGTSWYIDNVGNLRLAGTATAAGGNWQFPASDHNFGTTLPLNSWTHIALVNDNNMVTLYKNGIAAPYTTTLTESIATRNQMAIGNGWTQLPGGQELNAYIDEVRIVKGEAVYTSNFTPPSLPFGATESLLLHFDGADASTTFTDSSPNNLIATRNGNPIIKTDQSKFGGSAAYFDGSSSLTFSQLRDFKFSDKDFTIECWIRLDDLSFNGICGSSDVGSLVFATANGTILVGTSNLGPPSGWGAFSDAILSPNTWYHVAATRSLGKIRVFVNGIKVAEITESRPFVDATSFTVGNLAGESGWYFNGYIDDLRIIKGASLYNDNFTPPTLPLGASTSLLLHMDGSNNSTSFVDSGPNNLTITRNGNPVISTSQSKFGGSSCYFNGNSYLTLPMVPSLDFQNEDFTIEAFIYPSSSGSSTMPIISHEIANTNIYGYEFSLINQNTILFFFGNGSYPSWLQFPIGSTATDSWHHVAIVRNNGYFKCFWDGQQIGNTEYSSVPISSIYDLPIQIGARYYNNTSTIDYYFTGYIDELRIIKGASLYNDNFTPPNSPFI